MPQVRAVKVDISQHPLESVTVFNWWKAEIVRVLPVSLETGRNKIDIFGLSGSIDPGSVRVTGVGDAKIFDRIDVACSLGQQDVSSDSTSEAIRALKTKKESLISQKAASASASWILANYASTLKGEHISPDQADSFYDRFLARAKASIQKDAELDEEILQLARKIDAQVKEVSAKKGKTNGNVTAIVQASHSAEAQLRLTYLVGDVSWSPLYELHIRMDADKPARSTTLQYRARISQSTGEDWNEAQVILRTSPWNLAAQPMPVQVPIHLRPVMSKSAGSHNPKDPQTSAVTFVGPAMPAQSVTGFRSNLFGDPAGDNASVPANGSDGGLFGPPANGSGGGLFGPPASGSHGGLFGPTASANTSGAILQPTAFGSSSSIAHASFSQQDDQDFVNVSASEAALPTFNQPKATVSETPMYVSYRVKGETTVPSDGMTQNVSVAELPLEADVVHIVVPRSTAAVFLQAKIKNTSDYRLLPGPVDIYVDDFYVSKASMQDISPGDTFECALGLDEAVRVTYTRDIKQVKDPKSQFQEQYQTTTYTSRTVLRNKDTSVAREIILQDALPIPDQEDARIRVILRQPEELGRAEQGEECRVKIDGDNMQTVRWAQMVDGKGGKKDGIFEWVLRVESGKEAVVETVWDVKAPVDVNWTEA